MMDVLGRESAPINAALWKQIDETVIETARKLLIGRRFLSLAGPLGAGAQSVIVDSAAMEEELEAGIGQIRGRRFQPLIQLFEDCTLLWRDLESVESGMPLDRSRILDAARRLARREDELIFFGNPAAEVTGLVNTEGTVHLPHGDWSQSENAFADIAKGLNELESRGYVSGITLLLSPDRMLDLQRIQPGTGMLEVDRIARLIGGPVLKSPVLKQNHALLIAAEPENVDLALGLDLSTGYLETKDFNHAFRILETLALRIKRPEAIVVFD